MAYLQLMGGNLFLRKRNSKLSMMESFKMLMKDVEFVQEVQINSGASHDETVCVNYDATCHDGIYSI